MWDSLRLMLDYAWYSNVLLVLLIILGVKKYKKYEKYYFLRVNSG